MNTGIILAAGQSTRFGTLKQTICIEPCLKAMKVLDYVVIVTNAKCYRIIFEAASALALAFKVIVVDTNRRSESIKAALKTLADDTKRVVIHDVARPYITNQHISRVIDSSYPYVQYCLKLVNGLVQIGPDGCHYPVNRDDYLELCTPVAVDYQLACTIWNRDTDADTDQDPEPFDYFRAHGIEYELVYGNLLSLRKLTTKEDLML